MKRSGMLQKLKSWFKPKEKVVIEAAELPNQIILNSNTKGDYSVGVKSANQGWRPYIIVAGYTVYPKGYPLSYEHAASVALQLNDVLQHHVELCLAQKTLNDAL